MNVGFIGTGSMGSILIGAFIKSGALKPEQIIAGNRTIRKVERLAETYPGIRIARSNKEIAGECKLIFLCVKPAEFKPVVEEIRSVVSSSDIVISITSPVLISQLEENLPCKIAKIIPSITNDQLSGASLYTYGERITPEDELIVASLFEQISTMRHVPERYTRVASDISSCGPAFVAFFIQKFIDAAIEETGITEELATNLACDMLGGTGKLLSSGNFTPVSLQERVSVPGGITAKALQFMAEELDGMFNQLIRTTHAKYEEDLMKVEAIFQQPKVDQP